MFGRLCGRRAAVGALAAVVALLPTAASAIPAPDLIVSSVSGLSQLLAMLSVVLGGGLFFGARRAGAGAAAPTVGRRRLAMVGGLLFAVATLSIGLNVWQWQSHEAERQERLQATLNRPAVERGKSIQDPTLRELPYSRQIDHPQRIETHQVMDIVAERQRGGAGDYLFLDTRENIEVRSGSIEGFMPIRAPDFWAAVREGTIDIKNKKVIAICHNGNRSYELAEELASRGVDARFVAGGFEKWFVEGFPVTGAQARTPETLRAAVPYPNDRRLLDTPEVRKLVERDGAIFLDVRYEKEFEFWHLPGAVNIPMRKMTMLQVTDRLAQLPRRPIVIACYDRRGCFGARVLGYELYRMGHDFRGHYTLPWEYYEPVPLGQALPHVAQWQAMASASFYGRIKVALGQLLYDLAGATESLLWGILALAALSRLIVLPFTLRAERDQLRINALKPEADGLKRRLAHDPVRLMRALRALNKRHGINPWRSLLPLLFLPLFLVSIAAIELAAAVEPMPLLWIPHLGEPDPYYVLPVLFAALIAVYLDRSTPMSRRARAWVWLLGVPLLSLAMVELGAAANLYAVASAVLVIVQRELVALARRWPELRAARLVHGSGVVPLSLAHHVPSAGIKAGRLSRLIGHGFPVPPGLVIAGRDKS